MHQLCLGDESFESVMDRIVARACAVAPELDPAACKRLVELVFRSRVRQTVACGAHPECVPTGSVWADAAPPPVGVTTEWEDLDPESVPAMFAAAAVDLTDTPRSRRAKLELRLAAEVRSIFRDLLFCNPQCGHASVCRSTPVFPLKKR